MYQAAELKIYVLPDPLPVKTGKQGGRSSPIEALVVKEDPDLHSAFPFPLMSKPIGDAISKARNMTFREDSVNISLVCGSRTFGGNVKAVPSVVVIVKAGGAEPQYVNTAKDLRGFPIAHRAKPFGLLVGFLLFGRGLELGFKFTAVQVKSGGNQQRAQRKQRCTGGQNQLTVGLAQAGQQGNNP